MTHLPIGNTVRFQISGKKVFGTVRTEAVLTATGPLVKVELLPDFRHLLPTGWTDAAVADLTVVRVCECAKLGYIAQWGEKKGQLFTTGCDFSRQPGRTGKFLPGHDAKAKGFLTRAYFQGPLLDGRDGLTAARDLGDKIAAKVAEGIENEKARDAKARLFLGESPATRAVMRNLQRTAPNSLHEPIGYSFGNQDTDLETFVRSAKLWLRDKTELKTNTINSADYEVAYRHFVTDANK